MGDRKQNIMMDRSFDAACLSVKGEEEWSKQIMTRLKSTYQEYTEYIDNLYNFYVGMVTNNTDFLSRADYMIEHRKTIKLMYK